jgi:hypothetical protein
LNCAWYGAEGDAGNAAASCLGAVPLGGWGATFAKWGRAFKGGDEGENVWKLHFKERGLKIEDQLGGNLPANFPTIDKFSNGVATSIKSIDTTAATYQKPSALRSKLRGYVNSVANFQRADHGGVTIEPQDIVDRQLDLAVPAGGLSDQQLDIIQEVMGYGMSKGVTVNLWSI